MTERITGNRIRAAIYVRISKDRTGEALGVARQEQDCRDLAARNGWDVAAVYVDNDISASSKKKPRPAYRRMLADIQAGKLDAIIAWDTSRLYRQLRDLLELIEEFEKQGMTTIATVHAGDIDLSTPAGRTNAIILARINQQYSEETSYRIKRKKRELAEAGKEPGGGHRRFGTQGRKRLADGTYAPIITLAQALEEQRCINEAVDYLLDGGSMRGLTADWNAREINPPKGKQWKAVHLRGMLLSARLAGWREYHGEIVRDSDGNPVPAESGAIVDPEKWQRLRDELTNPTRTVNKGSNNGKYPLTGVLLCGRCGANMMGRQRKYRWNGTLVSEYRTYACQSTAGGCNGMSWPADDIEELIFAALFQAVETPQFEEAASSLRADDPTKPRYEALARITAALDKLDDASVEAALGDDGIKAERITAAINRKRATLEAEQEQHWAAIERMRDGRTRAAVPRNLRAVWSDLNLDRQKSILAACIESVTLYPRRTRKTFDPDSVRLVPKHWQ
jgi:DNA invertase Pin-like site-specific DNA recombinase